MNIKQIAATGSGYLLQLKYRPRPGQRQTDWAYSTNIAWPGKQKWDTREEITPKDMLDFRRWVEDGMAPACSHGSRPQDLTPSGFETAARASARVEQREAANLTPVRMGALNGTANTEDVRMVQETAVAAAARAALAAAAVSASASEDRERRSRRKSGRGSRPQLLLPPRRVSLAARPQRMRRPQRNMRSLWASPKRRRPGVAEGSRYLGSRGLGGGGGGVHMDHGVTEAAPIGCMSN